MRQMLINATHPDEVRVAITLNSVLIDLDIEQPGLEQKKANIYKGRITSIEKSLGAVFVDYGSERHGFLPLKEISPEYFLTQDPKQLENPDIQKILKIGQELVVQVDKEERGTKGAALTTFITLAGSYLVLMPNNPAAGGISRRIEGDERDQLRDIINHLSVPEGMGLIVRTAALEKSKEELEWDLKVLLQYWEAIKQAAIAKPGPYLIHQESDVMIRAIRDYLRQDISEIIVDDPQAHEKAKQYISQVRPDFLSRLKLYSHYLPLFSRYHIEQQIENAFQREVTLPSGGSIVIDHSEALVAIDINSARATKGGSIEETAYNTNLEAADEIARQLRLRDIGGLIVIDFIDMVSINNQRDVENRLREALKMDRARIQMGRISRFGLLEMSRQRLRSSLNRASQVPCPRCEGHGTIRSVESLGLSIIHLIHEHATHAKNTAIHVQVPVDVGSFLLNEKRNLLRDIEKNAETNIVVILNPNLLSPQYQIKTVKDEYVRSTPSYKLAKTMKPETEVREGYVPSKQILEPVIKEFLTNEEAPPPPSKKPSGGLIKRLWTMLGGSQEEKPVSAQRARERERELEREPTRGRRGGRSERRERPDREREERSDRGDRRPRERVPSRPRDRERTRERDHRDRDRDRGGRGHGQRGRPHRRDEYRPEIQRRHEQSPVAAEPSFEEMPPHPAILEKEPMPQQTIQHEPAHEPIETPHPVFTPTHDPDYKGLSQEEPMVQVTTKKHNE